MRVRPVKTQISLGIRPVWSESSLCAQCVAKDRKFLHADSEDSNQTGRMPRLIYIFAGRTATLLVLSCRGSFCIFLFFLFFSNQNLWFDQRRWVIEALISAQLRMKRAKIPEEFTSMSNVRLQYVLGHSEFLGQFREFSKLLTGSQTYLLLTSKIDWA